jgi:hypothetical protein
MLPLSPYVTATKAVTLRFVHRTLMVAKFRFPT